MEAEVLGAPLFVQVRDVRIGVISGRVQLSPQCTGLAALARLDGRS